MILRSLYDLMETRHKASRAPNHPPASVKINSQSASRLMQNFIANLRKVGKSWYLPVRNGSWCMHDSKIDFALSADFEYIETRFLFYKEARRP